MKSHKDKAIEIVERFDFEVRDLDGEVSHTKKEAIQCALICVEEIDKELALIFHYGDIRRVYHRKVKEEISKLQ